MQCISRYTSDTYQQYFADNKHKFYIEFRCNRPCFRDMDVCIKCVQKTAGCNRQQSRTFDHGKINEPIPEESHIYGGAWYIKQEKKWGAPPSEIIQFALMSQREARQNVVSKAIDLSIPKEMPKVKEITTEDTTTTTPVKKPRKPRVGKTETTEEETTTSPKKKKKKAKSTTSRQ